VSGTFKKKERLGKKVRAIANPTVPPARARDDHAQSPATRGELFGEKPPKRTKTTEQEIKQKEHKSIICK